MLKNETEWKKAVSTVTLLCTYLEVVRWAVPSNSGYEHMPHFYNCEGVEVQFLPHWGFYSVGGISLNLPKSDQDLTDAIQAVCALRRLGYRPKV